MSHLMFIGTALATLTLALGCGGNNSPTRSAKSTMILRTDVPCRGLNIRIPNELKPKCRLSENASASGCVASVTGENGRVVLDARDCTIDDGTQLFECEFDAEAPQSMLQQIDVACACGCAPICPTVPELCVELGDQQTCIDAPTFPSVRETPPNSTSTTTVSHVSMPTSSTTIYCGTCCDVIFDSGFDVGLTSDTDLSEIRFEVPAELNTDPYCPEPGGFRGAECEIAAEAEAQIIDIQLETTTFCILNSEGINTTDLVAGCRLNGVLALEPKTPSVLYATDSSFRAVEQEPVFDIKKFSNY